MPNTTFEDYFGGRTVLTGPETSSGDEQLILRSGTVFRAPVLSNKAFGAINHSSTFLTISAADAWIQITGLTDEMSTAAFTFASDAYTFVGANQIYPCSITVTASIVKEFTGNGSEEYEIGVFINGVKHQVSMSATVTEDATNPFKANITCKVGHILTNGDVIDARIVNRSGTDNVKVEDLALVIEQ